MLEWVQYKKTKNILQIVNNLVEFIPFFQKG